MEGIDLNRPIRFLHASPRYFAKGEHHIDRVCEYDVLVLIFDGVLRVTEDGQPLEFTPGTYHIQKLGSVHEGTLPSSEPRYFYVHFHSDWRDEPDGMAVDGFLPRDGVFDRESMRPLVGELDELMRGDGTLAERSAAFYRILSRLYRREQVTTEADLMADYLKEHLADKVTLDELAAEFHFSQSHVIRLFCERHGVTPFVYLNRLRIREAAYLLEATSDPAEDIAVACGFSVYSHFYRSFVKACGMSPRAWRTAHRL